jgi:hypothetical protein
MSDLLRLLYVSTARPDLSEEDLADILATSHRQNAMMEITGVLTYRAGRFAQILEGPELSVLEKYTRIARDERHSSVRLITITTTTQRRFEGWHMGGILHAGPPGLKEREIDALRAAAGEPTAAANLMSRLLTMLKQVPSSPA